MKSSSAFAIAPLFAIVTAYSNGALAAPPWVDRRIVLSGDPVGASIDVGTGFGHLELHPGHANGVGLNLEAVLGIVRRVDIGVRVGVRVNGESAVAQSDAPARFYDANTFYNFAQGTDIVANPEIRVRGKLLDLGVFELGLEGRAIIPAAGGTAFVTAFGVPMAVHAGRILKIDFGVYNEIAFYDPTILVFDVPANFWFQVTRKLWLGPMTGFRIYSRDRPYAYVDSNYDFILGFGLGVSLTRFLDLKTQIIFPRINEGAQYFGVGIGVGFVFE